MPRQVYGEPLPERWCRTRGAPRSRLYSVSASDENLSNSCVTISSVTGAPSESGVTSS